MRAADGAVLREVGEVSRSAFTQRARSSWISVGRSKNTQQPYWEQGGEHWDETLKKQRRQALRRHAGVVEALDVWWACALRNLPAAEAASSALHRSSHEELMVRIFKAMIDDGFDMHEASRSAAEDWERDAMGASSLGEERFKDALFELADLWAHDIDAEEYATLLWQLFGCLTKGATPAECSWKQLDEIQPLAESPNLGRYGRFSAPSPAAPKRRPVAVEKPAAVATPTRAPATPSPSPRKTPRASPRREVKLPPIPPLSPEQEIMLRRRRKYSLAVGAAKPSQFSPRLRTGVEIAGYVSPLASPRGAVVQLPSVSVSPRIASASPNR